MGLLQQELDGGLQNAWGRIRRGSLYAPGPQCGASTGRRVLASYLGIQHLRTHEREVLGLGKDGIHEDRLEDYIVSGLVDFDDVAYDDHADLLYDLAAQVARHFQTYLSEDDTRKVLRMYQRDIARFVLADVDFMW